MTSPSSAAAPRPPGETGFLLLAIALSCFLLWAAYGISRFESISSPGAFPMVCAGAMVLSALVALGGAWHARLAAAGDGEGTVARFVRRITPLNLVVFTAVIVAYMVLLERLGFLVASYLYLVVSMRVLGSRRWGLNLVISLLVLAAIYVVFSTAFSVVLPAGSLLAPYLPEFLK